MIVVFGGLLGVTGFFHADELRRLGAHAPARRGPAAATNRAPDSTEMAGEIVATDIEVPGVTAADGRYGRTRLTAGLALVVLPCALWRCGSIGLRYGLPAVYNPDEVAIMSRALAFAKGDLNPHNFLYPSFYFYALFAWEGLTAAAGGADARGRFVRRVPARVLRRSRRASSSRDGC